MRVILGVILSFLAGIAQAGTATITWTGSTGATGYRLYEHCGTAAEISVTLPLTPTQVVRNALPDGVTCYWQLTAFNAIGESARTGEVNKVMPGIPPPPTNVTVAQIPGHGFSIAYSVTAAGNKTATVVGVVPVGRPCIGSSVGTYRSQTYRRVARADVLWWTSPNDRVSAPCAAG